MSIGSRRHLVTLQRREPGRDALGQPLTTWADVPPQEYADIRFLRGLEAIRAGAQASTSQVSIRLSGYRAGLSSDMRVLDDEGVVYAIVAVLPDKQRRRYIDLQCTVTG